jgi:hypothetical protein
MDWEAAVLLGLGSLLTGVGGILQFLLQRATSNRDSLRQTRVRLYGELASLAEDFTTSLHHHLESHIIYLSVKAGQPSTKELEPLIARTDILALQTATTRSRLMRCLSEIDVNFKLGDLVVQTIDGLTELRDQPYDPPTGGLGSWKGKAMANLRNFIEENYGKPLKNLLLQMRAQLRNP